MTSESKNQEDAEREFEALDFTRMHFPSDQLSVLKLRQLHPELFDHGFRDDEGAQPRYFFDRISAEDGIGNLLFLERLILFFRFGFENERVRKGLAVQAVRRAGEDSPAIAEKCSVAGRARRLPSQRSVRVRDDRDRADGG